MQVSSKVIPTISEAFFYDGDANWYAEGCSSHPNTYGYLSLKSRWVNSKSAHTYANCYSIADYCQALKNGTELEEGKGTPLTVAKRLLDLSSGANALLSGLPILANGKLEKEFSSLAKDQACFADLGSFYGHKLQAVVAIRCFNDLDQAEKKEEALREINLSVDSFASYAKKFHENYKPMWLTWTGENDMNALLESAKEDIKTIEGWKKRAF